MKIVFEEENSDAIKERLAKILCGVGRYPHASVNYDTAEKPIKEYYRRLAQEVILHSDLHDLH